jgi:hypothetical protein
VPRRDKDLVSTGLSDHRKPNERTTSLRDRELQRCSQITIPMTDNQFGRLP